MDRSVGYEVPLTEEKSVSYPAETNLAGDRRSGWSGAVFAHNGVGRAPQDIASIWMGKAKLSEWLTRVFVPRPPCLVIFPAVAVAKASNTGEWAPKIRPHTKNRSRIVYKLIYPKD